MTLGLKLCHYSVMCAGITLTDKLYSLRLLHVRVSFVVLQTLPALSKVVHLMWRYYMKIDITLYVVTPHDITLLGKSPGLSHKVEQVKGPKPATSPSA